MLLVSTFVLASLLHVGPESSVSTPALGAPPHMQLLVDAAPGDDTSLVVWLDGIDPRFLSELRAARIDSDGAMLDAAPLTLTTAVISESGASVARADGRWLVVWVDDAHVAARFVEDDGTLGDVIAIAALDGTSRRVHVAFDGNSFLIAWDERPANRVVAALLDANGSVRQWPIDLLTLEFSPEHSKLLATRDGFAFVFTRLSMTEGSFIDVLWLDPSGGRRSVESIPFRWGVSDMSAIVHRGSLFIAWINAEWLHVSSGGLESVISTDARRIHDMATNHDELFILFEDSQSLRLDPLDEEGWSQPLPRGEIRASRILPFANGETVVAASIDTYEALHTPYPDPDLFLFPLDASLRPKSPARVLASEPHAQTSPAIARNDSSALVVWQEELEPDALFPSVLAMRVDRTGRALDDGAFLVADKNTGEHPIVASDGTDFLVGYHNPEGRLMVRRVTRDGSMPETAKEVASAWAPDLCMTWTGTEYLVGYTVLKDASRFHTDIQVRAVRVSRDGVAGAVTILGEYRSSGMIFAPSASIACAAGQTGTLFVWNGTTGANGAIVGHGGTLTAPLAIPIGTSPAIAANGGAFLVASYSQGEIARSLVSEGGTVTTPNDAPIAVEMDRSVRPSVSVAPSGSGYVLAFGTSDVSAVPLDAEGRASGPVVAVSATAGLDRAPAVAGGDVPIVAYQRERIPTAAPRWSVFTRVLFLPARRRAVR